MTKLTTLTPLLLLFSSKDSASVAGLKIPSLPSFALKHSKKVFIWHSGNDQIPALIPCTKHHLSHHFYLELGLANSELYHATGPLALYMISCHKLYFLNC